MDESTALSPSVLPDDDVTRQYVVHQGSKARAAPLDIGALEAAPESVSALTNLTLLFSALALVALGITRQRHRRL